MKFSEAFECMKQGAKVKLPSWGGFWFWDPEKKKLSCTRRMEKKWTLEKHRW